MSFSSLKLRLFCSGAGGAIVLPPVITSASVISTNENVTVDHPLTANQPGSWAKVGGVDAALFTLVGSTLTLPAQDYESPADADGNNIYSVVVEFTSAASGLKVQQTIACQVGDIVEVPPTGGSSYQFAPFLRPRELYRTVLVAAGDEYIDLQEEVATPFSPPASSWTISGTDAAKVEEISSGRIAFVAGTRAALAGTTLNVTVQASNDYGTSGTVALTIIVPANANCRFCSYETGLDANDGTTPALAWKHAPRAFGFTGTQVTLTAGKVLFFRGHGERHRYALNKGASTVYVALDHVGSAGNPFVYAGCGWGGRAVFDGADIVTGWTPCTSQADAMGNPNWENIDKLDLTTQGGAMDFGAHLYCGDVMCWPAQSPTPAEPNFFEEALDETEQGGMWRVPYTVTTAGAAPRIYKSGSAVVVRDARISALFGGSYSPQGYPFLLWNANNNITRLTVAAYDQANNQVTTSNTSDVPNSSNGKGAYTLSHHPIQIDAPGQFALSANRLTLYAWRPNAEVTSVSRRDRCLAVGHRSYVIAEGLQIQHYTGLAAGFAVYHGFTATMTGSIVRDIKIRDMRADGGDGLVSGAGGSANGWVDCNLERIHISGFNPGASGIRLANRFHGAVGGTAAQVRAHVGGKIRWCYIEADSIMRTAIFTGAIDGAHIYENVIGSLHTMHGNGISINDASNSSATSASAYGRYSVIELNFIDGVDRGYTVSISYDGDKMNDRFNTITRNVWLGINSAVFHPYSGEPGGVVSQNLMMGKAGDAWTGGAAWIDIGNRMVFENNVVAGIQTESSDTFDAPGDPLHGTIIPAAWTIRNNLDTTNMAWPNDANGTTRVLADNARAPGAPFYTWDGTFTAEMRATLGPGQIGTFWSVPA